MPQNDLYFVIPTYRLRDVGETVEHYDEHFWRNGHSVRLLVFDDSSPVAQEKYFPALEQTRTHNEVYYVGPREKEQFLAYLNQRLRDKRLESLVKNLFRPSYGGNRNCTLMYTLGGLMVSADDDMRPYVLMEDSPESLGEGEVCRGRLHRAGRNGYTRKSFDILRNPPAAEIFNEEVSNLLKRKIKSTLSRIDDLSIAFDYEGEVTASDAEEVLGKIASLYGRASEAVERASTPQRAEALRLFAANLQKAFYGFEPDFFQQNLLRIVDDVISVIKGSIELWPTLVEICYFQKERRGLPQVRVKNQKK